MEKGNDEEAKVLEGVLRPLIDAVAPKTIKEPKTRIGQLLRKLIREYLGDAVYVDIIDRFIIALCEQDPEEAFNKLVQLNVRLSNIVYEIEEKQEKSKGEE